MGTTETRSKRTPRGQGELLGERLVDAALAIIDRGEITDLSIRSVTREAGVSPTAFYLHFESREELLRDCRERSFEAFRDRIVAGADSASSPRERLPASGLAYIDFARAMPHRYALLFGDACPAPEAEGMDPQGGSEAGGDAFDFLISVVSDHLPADDPRRDQAETMARGIWTGIHGYVTLCQARPGMEWPNDAEFTGMLASAWTGEG